MKKKPYEHVIYSMDYGLVIYLCNELNQIQYGHYLIRIIHLIYQIYMEKNMKLNMLKWKKRKCINDNCLHEMYGKPFVKQKQRQVRHIYVLKTMLINITTK